MISNHPRFLEAIQAKNKVTVRFYSRADSGVVDRICAPLEYGPGTENQDGLNRYWLWDYASPTAPHRLGLLPQQIVDLQVLGEVFDPAQFATEPSEDSVPLTGGMPVASVGSSGGAAGPKL